MAMKEEAICWIEQMRKGSVTAFDQFYEAYAPLVLRTAQSWMGDRADAEDVCHDVFIEVLKKADQFDPDRGSIEAWLAVRTKYRAMDRLRKKQRELTDEWVETDNIEMADAVSRDTEQLVLEQLERDSLRTAMRAIPPMQQAVLYGTYFESKTHKELAEQMACPLGTVKSAIRYGLSNLKKQLQRLDWQELPQGGDRHE